MAQAYRFREPIRRLYQRGCVFLVAVTLGANSSVAFSSTLPADTSANAQIAELEQLRRFAGDVRATLDRSLFDLDTLLDVLDYDPESIIDFVREEIAFEQYPGLLRGAQGTLVSRSGNALDQAILLAKLLRDAGYDARIARGRLNEQQGTVLLRQMQRPLPAAPRLGDPEAALQVYADHGALQKDNTAAREALVELYQPASSSPVTLTGEAGETAELIRKNLAGRGVKLGSASIDRALLEEARDYSWVQYRDGAGGTWHNLHPAFADEAELGDVSFTTVHGDAVPAELQHRLEIRFFAERWREGKLEVFPISTAWERPVANLFDKPITLGILPNTLLELGNETPDLDRAIADASFFVPVLMDAFAPGAVFFDRYGNQLDPMAAQSAAAGLFGSLQEMFGSAIGQLSPGVSLPTITAQWAEFTLVAPGGQKQVYRRSVFDRIGPAARATGRVPTAMAPATPGELRTLLERQTLMVNVGNTSHALAMDQSLAQMIGSIDLLKAITVALYDEGEITVPQGVANVSSAWTGQMTLFASFDVATRLSGRHRIYRSGPALVVHRTALLPNQGTAEGIDIITNPRRAVPLDGPTRLAPEVVVDAGVWETQMEGTVVNQDGPLLNTMHAFSQAQAQGLGYKLLLPGEEMKALEFPADSRQHILRDLEHGFAVLVPDADPGLSPLGWWRVNLETGETLGMLADGRGSVITEYLVKFSGAISTAFLVIGLMGCLKQAHESGHKPGGLNRAACCVGANFLFFGIGWLGGNVVAGAGWFKHAVNLGLNAREYLAFTALAWDLGSMHIPICN